jgi:hypothetical protein
VVIENGLLCIWDHQHRLLAKVKRDLNGLYVLKAEIAQPICLVTHHIDDSWRWHERFGHLHFDALKRLGHEGMVRGLPRLEHVEQLCDTCVVTKHLFLSKPSIEQEDHWSLSMAILISSMWCGPISPATPGGRRYFLLLVDVRICGFFF